MKKTSLLIVSVLLLSLASFSQSFDFKNDHISIHFTEFKAIGEQLHCKFIATSISVDESFEVQMAKVKIFDMQGNEYFADQGKIGSTIAGKHNYLRSNLISGIPIKGEFVFVGAVSTRKEIALLEIPLKLKNQNLDFNIRMKSIKIPFGITASNKKLQSNKNYKEIDNNIFIELKTTRKTGNTLTFDFLITNFDDDKDQSLFSGKCKCFDAQGNEYVLSSASFGIDKGGKYNVLRKKCLKKIPIKMSINFEEPKIATLKEVKLLEINMNNNIFQFKRIIP